MSAPSDPFGPPLSTSFLRPLSHGPPTGIFQRFQKLADDMEEIAAKRSSSAPPEPAPSSDPYPEGEPDFAWSTSDPG
jgi:hypothetical protein